MSDVLDRGRQAFSRCAWGDAFHLLSAADAEAPLELDDLVRLAHAAYLVGRDVDCDDAGARAFRAAYEAGDIARAARCAFYLSLGLLHRGEAARGSGWVSRGQRLLDDAGLDCVEHGYLLLPVAFQHIFADDWQGAYDTFARAATIAERWREPDLATWANQGRGRTLIRMGDVAAGVKILDEAMVAVTAGEVSPWVAGDVYCSVIEACHEIFDHRRAQEWTTALTNWCAGQPDLVPYRGQCLVHRAQIMQLHGEWPDALDEARRACEWLSRPPPHPAIGFAHYQRGELHRLGGQFTAADEAYREAHRHGYEPQPGLALLRLAQGHVDVAHAAIRRLVDETHDLATRPLLLAACVEIALADGDVTAAHDAAEDLFALATDIGAPMLGALAAHARGAVRLAEGNAQAALGALRHAFALAHEFGAPHAVARARVLIAQACRRLGDEDGAELEFNAARVALQRLGAVTDLAELDRLCRAASVPSGGLTRREAEVLALVAKGRTNRAIATELVISEKTVARHVSNIFTKLGVSSRSAATAYAYEHDLL